MTDGQKEVCGVVMPISAIDGCSEVHWLEIREIIFDAIEQSGFTPNLVSDADDVGVIQKRIIQNLYDNPIVVCDVSGKNPNVMFELGMRLAFDKPTIIVKDDQTSYSFDTSAIEHIEYPRDLRFQKIVEFKEKLSLKIKATLEASKRNGEYTTFLKHFGEFQVAKIDKKEVSGQEYIIEELKSLRHEIRRIQGSTSSSIKPFKSEIMLNGSGLSEKVMESIVDKFMSNPAVERVVTYSDGRIQVEVKEDADPLSVQTLQMHFIKTLERYKKSPGPKDI